MAGNEKNSKKRDAHAGVQYAVLNDLPLSSHPEVVVGVDLHPVATSGDYNDLENKPNIPSDVTELVDRVDQLEGDV